MPEWLSLVAAVVGGLVALVWSADVFVSGAADGARRIGAPALIVGMVVIGFGTSAPELAVSTVGALRGAPSIALGNAYGSNVCNLALILGLCTLVRPPAVNRRAAFFALPALVAVSAISALLIGDSTLGQGVSRADSAILLVIFAIVLFAMARRGTDGGETSEEEAPGHSTPSLAVCVAKVVFGIIALVGSSHVLVWGAVGTAKRLGVSDLVIGLTVVAVGTSLPELASSLAAVRRGEDDLAVGNVVGSNLFNTLAVVGLAGAITPMPDVAPEILRRDIPASTLPVLFVLATGFPRRGRTTGHIGRSAGAILLLFYVFYVALLVRSAISA